MARIKMHILKAKLPFYPSCEVKCRLQNWVSTPYSLYLALPPSSKLGWDKYPRKKESVDSELARSRVSKFYWLVALGSRVWVLVSPFV